ncbi:MAG: ribonuclease HI [Chromatiaceae bacterium]|nr:MAG: ribonuclease HI [Chromatiaceae bacterium]
MDVIAWTDGGCRGNPGPGAWAFVLVQVHNGRALERAGAEHGTTNNRMELMAVLQALRALAKPGLELLIRSDSRYTIDSCHTWMPGWKARGWQRKGGPLKNLDLLQALDAELARHRVRFDWVKGHGGEAGNEHVDALLNTAMDRLVAGREAAHERRFTWSHPLPT